MELMNKIWESAKADKKKIVLPEGSESRTVVAAQKIAEEGIAMPILIGNEEEILKSAKEQGVELKGVEIIDPETSTNLDKYIEAF
ncbi:MAG: phosphate acyltransferase, partial [Clostridium baratii]|nr:phosphate acyltransferase [Clostridium baratii]